LRRAPLCLLLLFGLVLAPAVSHARARAHVRVYVQTPYLELHTGPGRGYPIFNVVPRGQSVEILFQRTNWLKVRTRRGVEGWASDRDMEQTTLSDGSPLDLHIGTRAGYTSHRFELGAFAGVWGGASLISTYGSLSFNSQLALEGSVGEFFGRYTNGVTADIGLSHVIVPQWRLSPFLMLGVGLVHTEPKATLVQPSNRTEQTAYVGGGLRFYLTRSCFVRAEYKTHVVFTKLDRNEVEDEWKLGFGVFF